MTRETAVPPRRRKAWPQFLGIAAGLLLISIVAGLPSVTGAVSPALLVAAVVAAAGLLIAVFVGMIRGLGELERRIVSEALALAFVVTLAAMFAWPFLEGLGVGRLRPQIVCAILVSSFAVGIATFSRRYE